MRHFWLFLSLSLFPLPSKNTLAASEESTCPLRFNLTLCTNSYPGRFWNSSKNPATGALLYQRHPDLGIFVPNPELDVRSLKPSDVQFIGAMGDSVTAGLFVGVIEKFSSYLRKQGFKYAEQRRNSFVTGWAAPASLVKLFSQYSPDIIGGSRGATAFMSFNRGEKSRILMDMNVAVSGTTASSLRKQVQPLVDALSEWEQQTTKLILRKNSTELRVGAKFLTVFVGLLNACWNCNSTGFLGNASASNPPDFSDALNETFSQLYSTQIMTKFTFPKPHENNLTSYKDVVTVPSPLYISLLELPGKLLHQMSLPRESSAYCRALSSILQFCKCSYSNNTRDIVYQTALTYNQILHDLAFYWNRRAETDGREKHFRIVVNSAFSSTSFLASDDNSNHFSSTKEEQQASAKWLSSLDCFHPNQCMQGLMAVTLWNQLFEDLEGRSFNSTCGVSALVEQRTNNLDILPVCPHRRIRLRN